MSLIGPVELKFAADTTDYGDFVTKIQRTAPAPITLPAINRDYSDVPKRGHAVVLSGVEEDLSEGTLWRYLFDNAGEKDVAITWSTASDGPISWSAVIAVVPDPSQGGQANQHGTFDVTIPLKSRPTLVEA